MSEWDEISTSAADWDAVSDAAGSSGSVAKRRSAKGGSKALRRLDAGIRGAADMMSFGFADEVAALGDSLPALMPGGESFRDAFDRNVAVQRDIDAADRQDVPVSRGAGQVAGFALGVAPGLAAAPGRGGQVANYLTAGAQGAGAGGLSAAGAAQGGFVDRMKAAVPGAALGAALGAAARPAAQLAGAGINALTARARGPLDRAARAFQGRLDPAQARARAGELRAAGAEPAAVSAIDEGGRGFVRAAASRMTPARETVQRRAEAAALNLPDRMSRQARNHLSADPRTPREIAAELAEARRTNADAAFGSVRGDAISMAPETVQALRNPMGREAIAEAARRERDPEVRAALNRLANDAFDDPSTQITVGMADRISRTLYGRAQAAARAGDNDLAATFNMLADNVRNPARGASSGYGDALAGYADESRLIEAADRGEDFLQRNTDEFVADVAGPGQPGNELARATARRAVERAAGENVSAAPGVARRLAFAPEQQARNRALLGDEAAEAFEGGMAAEARVVRDLSDVAPRTGSQTQNKTQDADAANTAANFIDVATGGAGGVVRMVAGRLRTMGLSDADAQAVADIATDPAQLDDLIARMEAMRPGYGERLREMVTQATARPAGEATQPRPAIEAWVEGRPDLGYGAAY